MSPDFFVLHKGLLLSVVIAKNARDSNSSEPRIFLFH